MKFTLQCIVMLVLAGLGPATTPQAIADEPKGRIATGLVVLYDFKLPSGNLVKDRSGVGDAVDLKIKSMDGVKRRQGSLQIRSKTLIQSPGPARKLIDAVRRSGAITLEAWVEPSKLKQDGPTRIVTLSKNGTERNFTLGQDGDKYDVRFRTDKTNSNGLPSLATQARTVSTSLTHVVYTRDRSGRTRLYLNGQKKSEKTMSGKTSNWVPSHRLALGDEHEGGRPWLGTYHLVAMYSRSLSPSEIIRNFKAGPNAKTSAPDKDSIEVAGPSKAELHFENVIAPLLSRQCLECHDAANAKGKLDLSNKNAAMAGGKNGAVIVAGKSSKSILWESVDFDDMPEDRDPLSTAEKKLLRDWIDDGAVWSMDRIDPAAYIHEGGGRENWLRRLTVAEYIQTVRDTVGVDISEEARELLPPDLRADGFSNTAYNLNVDLGHVSAYAQLARIIVERMDVSAFSKRFAKNLKFTDKDMGVLVEEMGKWVLRGPLEARELFSYRGISTTIAGAGGSMQEAVAYIIEAMLQSPRFIYRMEKQRGDGQIWPVGEYELASRLSYMIWGGPPDIQLMQAADRGDLYDPVSVESQVKRMLLDEKAVTHSLRFAEEWLNLNRLLNMSPSPSIFPNWNAAFGADMRSETLAYFNEIIWRQNRPLTDLMNAQVTFLPGRLAKHYGLKSKGNGVKRYDLTNVPARGGLLTQGSILTVGGDDASTVTRGLFVLHDLLRGVVKDPPPGLDTTPVPAEPGISRRGIALDRIANDSCGGCHSKFEPLSFGLEKFDGVGAHHQKDEHGNQQREDGEVLIPGDAKPIAYRTTAELMDILAQSDRVALTLTWKLTQFTLGRPLGTADVRIINKIHQKSQAEGGTYASVLTAIVMSDFVQSTQTETTP